MGSVYFCAKNGHNKDGCFKKIGYPEWRTGKGKIERNKTKATYVETNTSPISGLSSEQYQKLIKHFSKEEISDNEVPKVNMVGKVELDDAWIVDSGATEDITCNKGLFTNIRSEFLETPVTIPNGETIVVEGKDLHSEKLIDEGEYGRG
uniref:Retrovirus-related Pol polyprotein from transposon TNT 1-94-like beta-barrel domain-containing protein n=1 Tax=Lactuca sativa TaxID=4236 RepID=A0A9R1W4M3_LACSA|nr:hypothetical protein LSAT_V11C300142130 [Lactuca sativa]